MGSKFCVKFQRCPLKFRTKFWTHTPKTLHFTRSLNLTTYDILELCILSVSEAGPRCAESSHFWGESDPRPIAITHRNNSTLMYTNRDKVCKLIWNLRDYSRIYPLLFICYCGIYVIRIKKEIHRFQWINLAFSIRNIWYGETFIFQNSHLCYWYP